MARTKFEFDGEVLGFSKLGYAVIKKYCNDNSDTSLEELKIIFPDEICGKGKKCFVTQEDAVANMEKLKKKQYFLDDKEIITTSDGVKIAVSRLWGNDNIEELSAKAKELNYVIKTIGSEPCEETEKDRSTVYEYVILSEQGTDPVKKACRKEGIDIDNADPKNMAIIQTKVIANQIKNLKKSILKNIGKAKIIGELILEIERHDCSDIWSPLLIAKFKSNTNIDELKEGYYHVEQDLDGRHNTMIELTSNSIIDYECLGEYYLGDSEELAVKQDEELCREELENHKTDYKWDGIHIEFNDYKTRTVKSDEEIVHDQSAVYEYVVIHHQFPLQIINWSKNSIGDFVSAEPKDKIKVQTEMITYQAEQLKKSILKNIGEAKIIGKIEIEIQRLSYTSKQSPVIIAKFKSNYNIERLADDYFHVYQDILGRHNRMIELTTNSMTTNTDLKSYTDGFIEELSIFKDEYECSIELEEYKTDYEWDGKHIEFIED